MVGLVLPDREILLDGDGHVVGVGLVERGHLVVAPPVLLSDHTEAHVDRSSSTGVIRGMTVSASRITPELRARVAPGGSDLVGHTISVVTFFVVAACQRISWPRNGRRSGGGSMVDVMEMGSRRCSRRSPADGRLSTRSVSIRVMFGATQGPGGLEGGVAFRVMQAR
jgi:hypothetical protein